MVYEINNIELKKDIEYLSILAECPDITINSCSFEFGGIRLRAELILPSGQIIASEKVINDKLINDSNLLEEMKHCLLKDIGILFIENAYKKRTSKEVTLKVKDYYYTHKKIIDEVNDEKETI